MNNKIRQIIAKAVMCIGVSSILFMTQPADKVHADEIIMQTDSASLENPMVVPGSAGRRQITDSYSSGSAMRRRAASNAHVVYNGSYGDELLQSGSKNAYYIYQKLVKHYIGKDHSELQDSDGSLNYTIENLKSRYTFPVTTKQVANEENGTSKTTLDTDTEEYRALISQFKFDMQSAIDAFDYDYPEVFDLVANGYGWSVGANGDKRNGYTGYIDHVEVRFVEAYPGAAADVSRWRSELPVKAEAIRNDPDTDLNGDGRISNAELVKGIHDYLCERFYYDHTRLRNYTNTNNYQIFGAAAAVLDDLPMGVVCEGYSRSMKAFCDYFKIPACIIAGNVSSNSSMGHMWNAIRVGGAWYLTDVTWDDQTSGYRDNYLLKANITSGRSSTGRFSDTRVSAFTFVYPEISALDYQGQEEPLQEETESETAATSEEAEEPQKQSEPEQTEKPQEQPEPETVEEPQKQPEPEQTERPQEQTKPEEAEEPQKQPEPEQVEKPQEQIKPKKTEEPQKQIVQMALRRPQITAIKAKGGRKVLIRWRKENAVDGYELQYAYKKKFSGAKTVRLSAKKTSRTVKKLKKKKYVYVRIRTYKVVNDQKIYSKWSTKRKIKVK